MKILFSSNIYTNNQCSKQNRTVSEKKSTNSLSNENPYNVTFSGKVQDFVGELIQRVLKGKFTQTQFEKAQQYLKTRLSQIQKPLAEITLKDFNLTKLNGIQKGIEVFEGLSIRKIAFILDGFNGVLVHRGCGARCAHCLAKAIPQNFPKDSKMINSASFEDIKSLTDGIQELKKRLGFTPVRSILSLSSSRLVQFLDSDGMTIEILDKSGKSYDFTDLNDMLYETTGIPGIFDTAGWAPKHKKLQDRAEKVLAYFLNPKNNEKVKELNLSINPCHGILKQANEFEQANKLESAKKLRNAYVEMIANTLFTFTPLFHKNKFNIMSLAITVEGYEGPYGEKAFKEIFEKILTKLEEMYKKDYSGEMQNIKNPEQIQENLEYLRKNFGTPKSIDPDGRAKDLLPKDSKYKDYQNRKQTNLNLFLNTFITLYYYKVVDVNGRIWLTNECDTIPTKLKLNYANKHKETIPLGDPVKGVIITKRMVERNYYTGE